MDRLQFDSLFSSDTDWELNQYKILAGIKLYRKEFRMKRIYPALDDLLKLSTLLENLVDKQKIFSSSYNEELEELSQNNKELNFDPIESSIPDQQFFFDLVQWSLPHIKDVMEEGIILYDFVERNIKVNQLSLLPINKDEGYYLIPDNIEEKLNIYRFKCSLYSVNIAPDRALKTRLLQTVDKSLLNSSELIKNYLISNYQDFPNHASFICETDLEFPFNESLFPIAKKKLIDMLRK
jgi:hypothetical protein